MTSPLTNPLALPHLPREIGDANPDPAVIRIGTVARYAEGRVTVTISGSPTLIDAAYLTSYPRPVVGDLVVVARQGSAWMVLGALAGPPSDNAVADGSFEDTLPGLGPPSTWAAFDAGPGVANPTIVVLPTGLEMSGTQAVAITATAGNDANHSLSSQPFQVMAGQRWSARAYCTATYTGSVTITVAVFFSFYMFSGDTYPATSAANSTIDPIAPAGYPVWTVIPASSPVDGVLVPANARYARVTLRSHIDASAVGAAGTVYWDNVVARQVG